MYRIFLSLLGGEGRGGGGFFCRPFQDRNVAKVGPFIRGLGGTSRRGTSDWQAKRNAEGGRRRKADGGKKPSAKMIITMICLVLFAFRVCGLVDCFGTGQKLIFFAKDFFGCSCFRNWCKSSETWNEFWLVGLFYRFTFFFKTNIVRKCFIHKNNHRFFFIVFIKWKRVILENQNWIEIKDNR